jgi:hypothetical protein
LTFLNALAKPEDVLVVEREHGETRGSGRTFGTTARRAPRDDLVADLRASLPQKRLPRLRVASPT